MIPQLNPSSQHHYNPPSQTLNPLELLANTASLVHATSDTDIKITALILQSTWFREYRFAIVSNIISKIRQSSKKDRPDEHTYTQTCQKLDKALHRAQKKRKANSALLVHIAKKSESI